MNTAKKPNILWICTDQQRFDSLNSSGNKFVETLNIDRIAQNGVFFENAYCNSPTCAPSRASFLTSRYTRTCRLRENGQKIPQEEKLVTKMLQENGYVCGLSGKLHLAPNNPMVCKAMEERVDDGYSVFHWSHGAHKGWQNQEYFQWLREKGKRFKTDHVEGTTEVDYGMDEEDHQTTWCVQKAINFIEATKEDGYPWEFSINLFDPHHPFDPPKKYLEKYQKMLEKIPLPNYKQGELEDKPIFQKMDHKAAYNNHDSENAKYDYDGMSDYEHRLVRAAYWAMIDLIDKQVGRLLECLERTGQLDNTIIIFMSDHGEMLGDHGIYLKGPYFYEPMVKVPLIISWPGGNIKKGLRSKALVELLDLTPTLLEMLEIPKYSGMQGKSFLKILTGESAPGFHRDNIFCEYLNSMNWHKDPPAYGSMVTDGKFKLVKMHSTGEGELYDLVKDPTETNNLWKDESYKDVKLKMLDLLCDRICFTMDPLPVRQAPW